MASGSVIDTDTPSSGTGGAGGSAAAQDHPGGKLPRQMDSTGYRWSLERDTQFREILGTGLHATIGQGCLTAGQVNVTGVLSVTIPAGERFFFAGVVFKLTEDTVFNGVEPTGDTTLWVSLLRTPAPITIDPASSAILDNFSLEVEGTTGAAPSETHIPMAVITAAGGAITGINLNVGRKYLAKRFVEALPVLAIFASATIGVDHSSQFRRFDVGHTRVAYIDQDNVTALVDPNTVTETGFSLNLESTGAPTTNDYGSDTELRIVIECWGRFTDAE